MTAELMARPDARPVLEAWLERHGTLMDAAASSPDAEHLRGRGRVVSVPGPSPGSQAWVVRHYHRGGAVAGVLGDRYLRTPVPRPIREFRLLRALRTLGVPAVEAVGAAVYAAGLFYRGDLVTERVAGMDLGRVLFGADQLDEGGRPVGGGGGTATAATAVGAAEPAPDAAMAAAGRLVRLLHERGVVHPDLNLKNVLIVGAPAGLRAMAVDLDRARIQARVGQVSRRRMLARFERSLRKWEAATGTSAPPGARAAFEAGYAESPPEPSGASPRSAPPR